VGGDPARVCDRRRAAESFRGRSLSFARGAREGPAAGADRHRTQRGRSRDGDLAPFPPGFRRPVPSRVRSDPGGGETARQLPAAKARVVTPDVAEALKVVAARRPLPRELAERTFLDLMDGKATEAQKGAILLGIATRGETAEEIAGAVAALRARMRRVPTTRSPILDTCGPGGIGRDLFNVSTAAAVVAAGAGASVAKHGNRSISS